MKPEDSIPALLQQISERSDELYEDAPCGFIFTLPDGLIIKANRTFLGWTGYANEEVVTQKRFQDLLTIGGNIYYETHHAPLLRMQGFLNEVTLDLHARDRSKVPALINSSEVRDESGKVILVRSTVFNITDRRKYERELLVAKHKAEQSERRLGFLAKAGDILGNSIDKSQSFDALARLAANEFCDACTIELVNEGRFFTQAAACRFENVRLPVIDRSQSPQSFSNALLVTDCHDGSPSSEVPAPQGAEVQSYLRVPILAGQKAEREVVGILGFYMLEMGRRFSDDDLTLATELATRCWTALESWRLHAANVQAAEALKESFEWFSTTLRSIGDAVIAVTTDKLISFMNPVAVALTGWSLEEAQGQPMDEVFKIIHDQSGEPALNPVDKVLKEGGVAGLESHTALIRKDGQKRIIEDSAAPITDTLGRTIGVVLVFRDATEKHAEDLNRQHTLMRLQEEREVREKFVATLTHDLRSPITAVKMSAQMILRKTDQPALVQTQAIRVINSVNRADQMIQDLLDANRIRAGEKIPLEMKQCDLSAEVRDAVVDLVTIHGDRFEYDGATEVQGFWNCAALRRIVENLGNNAVKYGAPHSPIKITLTWKNDRVELSVHNFGNPISEKDQSTLFEPYRRTASAQLGGQKGWGLGLTLVRGVAEAHGGTVSVRSSPTEGTFFTVSLPKDSRLQRAQD